MGSELVISKGNLSFGEIIKKVLTFLAVLFLFLVALFCTNTQAGLGQETGSDTSEAFHLA